MIYKKVAGKCPFCGSELISREAMCPDGETTYHCTKCDKECFKATINRSESYRDVFNRALPAGHIIDYHIQGNVFYGVVEGGIIMGWIEVHKEPCSYRDYFNEGLKGSIIDSHTEKGVFYGALRHEKGVFALVILVRPQKGYFNLAYKWMDESFHPYNYDCPDRILDLLTPTESKNANDWRSICRERNKRKKQLKKGTVIKFTEPIKFTNGMGGDTFQYAGRNRFKCNGYYYNIRNWSSREFTVLM